MHVRLSIVALVCSILFPVVTMDTEFAPRPYIVVGNGGEYFFKMSPDPIDSNDRDKGIGRAYKAGLGEDNALLWSVSGWYADQVFLSADGRFLVRIGNWPRGNAPSQADMAIAFYDAGKLLKAYATDELIRDESRVPRSVGHYSFLCNSPPKWASEPTLVGQSLVFQLVTSDMMQYAFDARSGEIISATQL